MNGWFAIRSKMKESGLEEKNLKNYNAQIEKAIRKHLYRSPNFFIIAEGIHPDEHSVIWIENNTYRGFGYFNPELTTNTPDNLKELIKHDEDDLEVQKIIRAHLRKMKNSKIVSY